MPFLAGIIACGAVYLFTGLPQAAAVAAAVFGIAGAAEYAHGKSDAQFAKSSEKFRSLRTRDSETFLKFTDKVFGSLPAAGVKTQELQHLGLLFRYITTVSPGPFGAIAGPLCPVCGKNLSFSLRRFPPGFAMVRYECLCGFCKTLRKDPLSLYKEVRVHFNLPLQE